MEELEVTGLIKKRFAETGNPAQIPKADCRGTFSARLADDGIYVDKLGNQPFFQEISIEINI